MNILWSLFGNAEDGNYGERSGEPGYDPAAGPLIEPRQWRAVCWWFRNPFHNLCFHTWRKPGGWFINTDWGYIGHRPNPDRPERDGVFGAALFRRYGS